MRLALKLSLLLAAASAAPLLVGTEVLLQLNRREMRAQLEVLYRQNAQALADQVDGLLIEKAQAIALAARGVDFTVANDDQVSAALQHIYTQIQGASVVGLFDASGVRVGAKPLRFERPEAHGFPQRESVSDQALAAYATNMPPLERVLSTPLAFFGVPYVAPAAAGRPVPRVVVALRVDGVRKERWVIAVEVSLRSVMEQVAEYRVNDRDAFLVDQTGRVIAHAREDWMASRVDLSNQALVAGRADPSTVGWAGLARNLGWRAVVAQPASTALAPIEHQTRMARLWGCVLGLAVAFVLGFTTVRSVTRPVNELQRAADSVARGDLDAAAVAVPGRDELAQLGDTFNAMTRGLRERERLKQTFSRYVSEEVASRILKESSDLDLKGELVEVSVVFIDVRNFTSLAERHTPREVVDLLNAYFARIIDVVMKYEGVINNFIGDAVMAVFGVPREIPHPELRAVSAALEIQRAMSQLGHERLARGLPTAEFGIGVNTGSAIAGNLGSPQRMQYTVVGDAVNLAQRLQTQARPGDVLISTSTLQPLAGRFSVERLGAVKVKGKEQPVEVYRVLDPELAPGRDDVTALSVRQLP